MDSNSIGASGDVKYGVTTIFKTEEDMQIWDVKHSGTLCFQMDSLIVVFRYLAYSRPFKCNSKIAA